MDQINPDYMDVIDELSDFVMTRRPDWEGKYGGMVIITLPAGEDLAVGNVMGFMPNDEGDSFDMTAECLVSLMTGLFLMGFSRDVFERAITAAETIAENASVIEASDMNEPEN